MDGRSRNDETPTSTQVADNPQDHVESAGTLRLRGENATQTEEQTPRERRITWAEDVIDNEGQSKKSSKVCCIYHKPRPAGESSSESESSDSDSDAESSGDEATEASRHSHSHGGRGCSDDSSKRGKARAAKNAYERVPKSNTTVKR
ncbi:Type 1 phosphatases regulator ypi1 [Myotisia sp. PD_48]|nr:Type 1 phosphatases regulator ypi1 [Myotisia sp. PD_48]